MKTQIPDRHTQRPSREGLVYHEVLADGLIHTAAVFGFEPNEKFLERVAALAWANGVHLVRADYSRAAEMAIRLTESLEVGRQESRRLTQTLADHVAGHDTALAPLRDYYGEVVQTRLLRPEGEETVRRIRHLIGEALLGGLQCRGAAPSLYQHIAETIRATRHEQAYLTKRVDSWSRHRGTPRFHPFIEMVFDFYEGRANERELICEAVMRLLPAFLEREDPWCSQAWLEAGWREGAVVARYAPDLARAAIDEQGVEEWEGNLKIYQHFIEEAVPSSGAPDTRAGFEGWIKRYNPYDLQDGGVREGNPRMVAFRAFDYAFWMGMLSGLPKPIAREGGAS